MKAPSLQSDCEDQGEHEDEDQDGDDERNVVQVFASVYGFEGRASLRHLLPQTAGDPTTTAKIFSPKNRLKAQTKYHSSRPWGLTPIYPQPYILNPNAQTQQNLRRLAAQAQSNLKTSPNPQTPIFTTKMSQVPKQVQSRVSGL